MTFPCNDLAMVISPRKKLPIALPFASLSMCMLIAQTDEKTVGRAETLRRALLALIDKGEAQRPIPPFGRRSSWLVKARGEGGDTIGAIAGCPLSPHGRNPPLERRQPVRIAGDQTRSNV